MLTLVIKTLGPTLTDTHGGLAPKKQLQALGFTVHTAVMESRVAQGRLLIQVPAKKLKYYHIT